MAKERTVPYPQKNSSLGKQIIKLGYVPLIDCAPILIAREHNLFEKHGIRVQTFQQPGWATVREKLVHSELDAAECLGPLAVSIHHGIGTIRKEMVIPLIMSANGNGLTLSNRIPPEVLETENGLLEFLEKNYSKKSPLTLATIHPCSSHHSLLLMWLKQHKVAGHPFISFVSLPPEVIVRSLANGHIEGFCVGEPWNSVAILDGLAWSASNSVKLSNGHPEKVLAVTNHFAQSRPSDLQALIQALLEACCFCQNKENHSEILSLLAKEPGMNQVSNSLPFSLNGRLPKPTEGETESCPSFHIFYDEAINAPTSQTASWLRNSVRESGLLAPQQSLPNDSIFRMDLFEEAYRKI